jgi:hypothetical protein
VGPTFYADVLPILQRSCASCHMEDRIAGFSFLEYEDAKPMAGVMAAYVEAGIMPPWHALETEQCQPRLAYRDDPRLSAEDVATLRAWAETGAAAGDPADAPSDELPPVPTLDGADLELVPTGVSVVEGSSDQFTCVVYDPELTAESYLDGIHIEPSNTKVAHHALLFRVNRDAAIEASGGNERFPCFGSPPGDLIHAWAPGAVPLELPDSVAMPIGADQVIVVQMHYHPTGDSTEEDRSKVLVRFAAGEPEWDYNVSLPGNASGAPNLLPGPNDGGSPEFRIPAGAEEHVEAMSIEVPAIPIELPILIVATHMHYVGTDARLWIERPTPGAAEPASECLVHTPYWDFNWQRGYMFDGDIAELPTASGGDILRLECHYNNSMKNPFVAQALEERGLSSPEDVYLGEETLDEMCLGVIGFLTPHGIL